MVILKGGGIVLGAEIEEEGMAMEIPCVLFPDYVPVGTLSVLFYLAFSTRL